MRAAQNTFEEDQEREEQRQSDLFHELFGGGSRDGEREVGGGVRHRRYRHGEDDDDYDERERRRRDSRDRYLPDRYY